MAKKARRFDYDVALSFAGEDRKYVHQVAEVLHQIGAKVFYDNYERVDLWGKNLYTHLDDVYQNKSRYCVIFVSKFYKRKLWTNHERESAQARAFKEREDYILAAKFDHTKIPGLRATRGYIDLANTSPTELAHMILAKIGMRDEIQEVVTYLGEYLGNYTITVDGTQMIFECKEENYVGWFPVRLILEMHRTNQLRRMFLEPAIVPH